MISNSLKIKIYRFYRKIIFHLPFNYYPDFLIIGVQKAGTTTLFNYLNEHRKFCGSVVKEVGFFNRDDRFNLGYFWYKKHFKSILRPCAGRFYFEATPEYIIEPLYLNRIRDFNPAIKLVIILRDPVSRAFSAWNFYKKFRQYKDILPDFAHCVEQEMEVFAGKASENWVTELRIIRRGLYKQQLQNCFDLFDYNQVLVLSADELKRDPGEALNKVLLWLGVPASNWSFLNYRDRNVGSYSVRLSDEIRSMLKEFYKRENAEMKALLEHNSYNSKFDE